MLLKDRFISSIQDVMPGYVPELEIRDQVDSLNIVSIVTRVENEFSVEFSPFEITDIFSGTADNILSKIKIKHPMFEDE